MTLEVTKYHPNKVYSPPKDESFSVTKSLIITCAVGVIAALGLSYAGPSTRLSDSRLLMAAKDDLKCRAFFEEGAPSSDRDSRLPCKFYFSFQDGIEDVHDMLGSPKDHQFFSLATYPLPLFLRSPYVLKGKHISIISPSSEMIEGFIGNEGTLTKEMSMGIIAHEIGHVIIEGTKSPLQYVYEMTPFYSKREEEVKADLLSLRHPILARGLRDSFQHMLEGQQRAIESCKLRSSADKCIRLYSKKEGYHPSHVERVQYLTEALCVQYPKENPDICYSFVLPILFRRQCVS